MVLIKVKSKKLYVYSTAVYLEKGWVKVGESLEDRVDERIDEQFGTSNPELPLKLWEASLPENITDKHIHRQLEKNGVEKKPQSSGREWFVATVDEVKKAYNQLVFGSSRIENYNARNEQQEAIEKAKNWFQQNEVADALKSSLHKDRFLLNAKMRFGKCFTGLNIAKAIDSKNTIIVTYKPEVISEWMETANGHIAFEGWTGIRARKKNSTSIEPVLDDGGNFPQTTGPIVLCVSLQDLEIDEDGNTKIRLARVLGTAWDLVIFDEVHFGSGTDRAKNIIEKINARKRLDLSGTPFKLIQQDDFCPEQVYTYSYIHEQINKKKEIEDDPLNENQKVYREMPDLNIATIDITDEDIKQQTIDFKTDDIDFSLNELFRATSRGTFAHEDAVDNFLDGLVKMDFDAKAISVFGKLGSQLGVPPIRHTVWWLNRVDSVSALVRKLNRHPYFSRFEIINASGCVAVESEEEEATVIAKDKEIINGLIKKTINDPTKLGTITLTCKRFLTGVTIKEWDSILVLNDTRRAESYFQAIFRVQSAWVDRSKNIVLKDRAWVFDFAISRCLSLTHEYGVALTDQEIDSNDQENYEENQHKTLNDLAASLDIKRFYEGKLTPHSTSAQDILDALNQDSSRLSLARKITSDALVDFTSLVKLEENPQLFEILKKIKGYRTQDIGSLEDYVQIGKDMDKKKKEKTAKDDNDEDDEIDTDGDDDTKEIMTKKKWFATQIKRLAICMADFIYMTYEREYNIHEVIHTKSPEFFSVMTGISKDEFKTLCDMGFINIFALNKIVREFRYQEESSLSPEEFIFNLLKDAA